MADDVEPSDKRTKEWREWEERQRSKPKAAVMPDPNVFCAHFFAALASSPFQRDYLTAAKQRWHEFRQFVEWVANGEDVKDYAAHVAKVKAEADKKAEIERKDREAAEDRAKKNAAQYGNRAPSVPAPVS